MAAGWSAQRCPIIESAAIRLARRRRQPEAYPRSDAPAGFPCSCGPPTNAGLHARTVAVEPRPRVGRVPVRWVGPLLALQGNFRMATPEVAGLSPDGRASERPSDSTTPIHRIRRRHLKDMPTAGRTKRPRVFRFQNHPHPHPAPVKSRWRTWSRPRFGKQTPWRLNRRSRSRSYPSWPVGNRR